MSDHLLVLMLMLLRMLILMFEKALAIGWRQPDTWHQPDNSLVTLGIFQSQFEFSRHLRDFSLVFTLQSSLDSYFDKRTLLSGPLCLFLKSQNLFCATTARKLGPQNSVLYESQVPSVQHLNKYLGWMRLSEISIMCFSFLVSCKVNTCLHVTRSHTPDGAWVPNSYFCKRFSKEDQA